MALSKIISGVAALAFGAVAFTGMANAADLTGAGATFPYPVYSKWAEAYKAKTGVGLNYQSIGSGGGIKQIKSKTVNFGASDAPLTTADLAESGLVQFPTVIGGIVPVVNLKGIEPGQLKLTGQLVGDIYLGKITQWNDPAIAQVNPGLALPAKAIAPVYRSDGSGTTFVFSSYLSGVNPDFKAKIGANAALEWPAGIGGKGNEGVAALASRTDGAIGYVEYAYAKKNKLTHVSLQNKDGQFVQPEAANFAAAASNVDFSKVQSFAVDMNNQPGATSWPITSTTFILVYKDQADAATAKSVLDFFAWAYADGDKLAQDLDYVPLPDKVVKLVEDAWSQIKADGKPVWNGAKS